MEQILVIQLAKLGDFIQSTALLANLRRVRPEAEIFLLAKEPSVLEAARLSPLVDRVFDSPEDAANQSFFEEVYTLNSHIEATKAAQMVNGGRYFGPRLVKGELVFPPSQQFLMSLMMIDRILGRFNLVDVWSALVPGSKPLPTAWPPAIGPAKSGPQPGQCAAEASLITPQPRPSSVINSLLNFQPKGPLVGMQLGCRNHLRRWPVEHFVSLGEELIRNGLDFTPVLLGSKDERALAKKFISLWGGKKVLDLIGGTDLQSLAASVESLDLLISGDTGVMHLAAAKGRPVLSLFFGPAYGPETGPYGAGHLIYQASAPCAPCLESSNCRRRQCLEMPQPEIAAAYAGYLLKGEFPDVMARPALPQGHRLWFSSISAFGQDLTPLDKPDLIQDEALALLLTEAGRPIIRPTYKIDPAALARVLSFYKNVDGCSIDLRGISKRISTAGFPGRPADGRAFMADVHELAAKVGLNIA